MDLLVQYVVPALIAFLAGISIARIKWNLEKERLRQE